MAGFGFHPEALLEYADAITYYLSKASPVVAERFIAAVESSIASIQQAPDRWRIIDKPEIRRYVFKRFPYVLYYRWDVNEDFITIFAIMHCRRDPGHLKHRVN